MIFVPLWFSNWLHTQSLTYLVEIFLDYEGRIKIHFNDFSGDECPIKGVISCLSDNYQTTSIIRIENTAIITFFANISIVPLSKLESIMSPPAATVVRCNIVARHAMMMD